MKKIFAVIAILCETCVLFAQVFEQFTDSNIGSAYSSGSFLGNKNVVWNYVNCRGNQKVTKNGDKAISFNKDETSCLFTDTISYGIKSLSFLYEQTLATNCELDVYVNDSCVAIISTNKEKGITKEFSCDLCIEGSFVLQLKQHSSNSGQITIDDIAIEYMRLPFTYTMFFVSDSLLQFEFSQSVKNVQLQSQPNDAIYSLQINDNKVVAKLNESICGRYEFTLQNIENELGETLLDSSFFIEFYTKPQLNTILITEIMADPSPSIGLPEYEYIELYNNSDCAVQCSNLQLFIGNNQVQLPDSIIDAYTYVCVCSAKAKLEFENTNNFVFVSSFPSITNDGQTIAIYCENELVSSVTFSSDWFRDNYKAEGGWALEKIDIENCSEQEDNWKPAENRLGGTPGFANSVSLINIDNSSPYIKEIQVFTDTTLLITFSENVWLDKEMVTIQPSLTIQSCNPYNHSLFKWQINTLDSIKQKTEYHLFIDNNFCDLATNFIQENEFVFAITDSALQRNAVIFNEILFNPKSGESDFVELYNNSNSYFDLSTLYLSDGENFYQVSNEFQLFPPYSFALISLESEYYKQNSSCKDAIFVTSSLPTMPDDAGTLILYNRWEEVIDSVQYNKNWHSSYLTDIEGVSLEKISYNSPSEKQNSWFSATEASGFSTPGCENSQMNDRQFDVKSFSLEYDVATPNDDGDKDMFTISCGEVEQGTMCTLRAFSTNGHLIKQIANNQLIASNEKLFWNCTDNEGKLVPAGIYIIQIELTRNGKRISKKKLSCSILRE